MPTPPTVRCTFLPICAQGTRRWPSRRPCCLHRHRRDVHEGRHQHHALRDIGRPADDAARHGAKAGGAPAGLIPALPLGGHLVPTSFAPPFDPEISYMSVRRKDRRTAFLAHWFTCQSLPRFSATRSVPLSSASSVASMAFPRLALRGGDRPSRAAQAVSMAASSARGQSSAGSLRSAGVGPAYRPTSACPQRAGVQRRLKVALSPSPRSVVKRISGLARGLDQLAVVGHGVPDQSISRRNGRLPMSRCRFHVPAAAVPVIIPSPVT